MNIIFFELIRIAIGTQDRLSRLPLEVEWEELFEMAVKQSLVGVCFVGLKRHGADADEGFSRIGISEIEYLDWMGMAVQILYKNEVVNHQCAELQKRLAADGFRSCVLKGQGVATLYGEELRGFRQSGDIDLWVDAPKKDVVSWAMKVGMTEKPGYLHVGTSCFADTIVELHYRPTYLRSFRHNRRLQKFCENHRNDWTDRNGMIVPSWEFDVVYQLSHIYRHLFGSGIGLRQLMDFFFVLKSKGSCSYDMHEMLSYLGLRKFAGAVMYVLYDVFHLEEEFLICPVDEKRGKALLDSVMQAGNFGKMDMEQKKARSTAVGRVRYKLSQWWKLMRCYPEEALSAPIRALVRKR